MDLAETECEGVNWIHMVQNKDQCVLTNTVVTNLSWLAEKLSDYQEELCSMELIAR
jgi:hypothetical protein